MAFQTTSRPLFLFSLLPIAGKELYPHGSGKDATMPPNDDNSSEAISVNVQFYGRHETKLFVRGYD